MQTKPTRRFACTRRDALSLLGLGAMSLFGLSMRGLAQSRRPAACIARPSQVEGPYFVDERLNRSDIITDPATGLARAGVPLELTFFVAKLDSGVCAPLPNAQVDVWHCDALGAYSDAIDDRFDTRGQRFLRGYQITDANGAARFRTIYPGWYPGRAVHVHFKIRYGVSSMRRVEFTSQVYFDDALTDAIHDNAPYASLGDGRTRNAEDGIYARGGRDLTMTLAKRSPGYLGTFAVGLYV
jgi:protocatechuate 3,4-dioxygenase beta subunit